MNVAAVALGAAGVALSIWNVSLAGAIARTPARERLFRVVTALAGLFLIPGLLVAMASGSVLTARVADGIWWFWPLAVTLFAVQSTWAVAARLATPVTGVPIALWNIALMVAAWANALVQHDLGAAPPPEWADATLRMAMATLVGPGALSSPLVVWLPAIGPAYPPRWGIGTAVRATIALACAGALALVGWTVPRTRALQASFDRFGEERLTERPRGDFVTGLAILPVLDHPTPPGPLVADLALADTMEADLLLVTIAPTVRASALDSMARVLEETRHDSSIVAMVPEIGANAPAGPERERMLVALERAARSLQPDIVFTEPARLAQVGTEGVRRRWFEQVRTATRRGGSRARVLPLVRTVPADKAWFLWADSAARVRRHARGVGHGTARGAGGDRRGGAGTRGVGTARVGHAHAGGERRDRGPLRRLRRDRRTARCGWAVARGGGDAGAREPGAARDGAVSLVRETRLTVR